MNKQELYNKVEDLDRFCLGIRKYVALNEVMYLIKQLDEPQKVVIPQYVADWIEKAKQELSLRDLMSRHYVSFEVDSWLAKLDEDGDFINQETFARAVLDGYTVEEEKLYFVKLKAVDQYLVRNEDENFLGFLQSRLKSKFTRKQLEQAELGWVFDCTGIEVEEVE